MHFFLPGCIIVMGALLLLIVKHIHFKKYVLFFIPFSGTAVCNISGKMIALPFILAVIAILYHLLINVHLIKNKVLNIRGSTLYLIFLFFIFSLSAFMPAVLENKMYVADKYSNLLTYADEIPLHPSMQYVTQLLYALIGIVFVFYIKDIINSEVLWLKYFKTIVYSYIFICLWGLFEYSCYYIGIQYPTFLFSQAGLNADGIKLLNGRPRITSATLEPSVLAQSLSFIVTIMLFLYKERVTQFSRRKDALVILLFAITLLLSNSSTSYIVIFLLCILYFKSKIKLSKNFLIKIAFVIVLLVGLGLILPVAINYISYKLTDDYSGQERTLAIVLGIAYFAKSPVMGIGWGVFPVWDFVVCTLCGAGIIGLSAFIFLFYKIYLAFRRYSSSNKIISAVAYASFVFLMANESCGFLYYTQYVWLYLGCIISILSIEQNKSRNISTQTWNR